MKAELDNGSVRMMAGGTRAHDRIRINLIVALDRRLEGTGCRPSGSDMGIRTHDSSLRYPDVSVICGRTGEQHDALRMVDDPIVIVEVLSPTTDAHDRQVKLPEYQRLASVETIVFIDPDTRHMTIWHCAGRDPHAWTETRHTLPADLDLPSLGLTIPHTEVFRR